ncbi:hypothetical protein CRM22_001796 [Opisthorchis felineus]|uniref:Metallo-beta-lactamase domain-containing protein n=1 Tax=Opisthorchis felineus TaxID=147828 RepID=A0A4S2MDC1_OPIFE|nr:hypothetical protein CRM22_001796 [Opisthorchis felineus]
MDSGRQFDTSHLEFKLKRLSSDIHNPCYLLHLRDVNVLLDCCIETSALVHFLPSHQLLTPGCSDLPVPTHENVSVVEKSHATSVHATQDDCQVTIGDNIYLRSKPQFCLMNKTEFSSVIWDAVDVILVSNTNSILGLPFICSATNFRGRILATEPVVKFGKVLMEDLLDALEQLPPCKRYPVEQLKQDPKQPRSFLHDFLGANDRVWKEFYSRQTIKDTLDRIQLVAYHEPVDIFGLLTICGSSAGFGIGSCNWTLTSPTEKVAYISHTSLLYSHVLPFDDSLLADVDVLIMGTVNLLASTQLERTVNEFRHIVVQTLARGGHVLVPINPCGMLFDLIETAIHAKENFKGTIQPLFPREKSEANGNGQSQVPPTNTSGTSGRDSVFLDNTEGNNTHNSSNNNSVTPLGGSSLAGRVARSPVFAVSSQINVSLAYANAYGEWLNPEKEALLYTADAPFPFQALLRSGHLLPLESLHHTPTVKGLGDPQSRSDSPAISTSPLVLGPNTRPGDWFSSGAATTTISTTAASGAATLETSTIVALAAPSARDRQAGLSGGVWPSSPCLIFASHPSLRFGSVVHLIRALAYGDLRPGTRTAQAGTPAPRHSIILVESGDYIHSPTTLGPARCLQHLLNPYALRSPDKSSDTICSTSHSPTGVPTCDLSETATVFWLPMEARLGPEELPHLLSRCRSPRLTLCLPTEMAPYLVESLNSGNFTTHYIAAGQKLRLPTLGSKMQPVRLSAQLVRHLRPVHLTDPHSKSVKASTKGQSDPRIKPGVSGILAKSDVSTTILSGDHDQTLPSGSKRISTPSTDNTEPDIKRSHKVDTNVVQSSVENSCLALVDGLLTTRDGKYWLNDPRELESSGTSRFSSNRAVRPSTPPLPAALAGRRGEDDVKSSGQSIKSDNRVFVSHIPRIEPFRLIKELTERGVTGAYLADKSMVSHIAQRFPTRDHCGSDAANGQSAEYILFPNPNTVIQLADHSSHILTADEGTRTTIRDSILSCLLQLETRVRTLFD